MNGSGGKEKEMLSQRTQRSFLFLIFSLVLFTGCRKEETYSPGFGASGQGSSTQMPAMTERDMIYLVPIEKFPEARAQALVNYLIENFRIPVRLLPKIALEERAVDRGRQQLIGEELTALLQRRCPQQAKEPGSVLIGLTDIDIYLRSTPEWKFAFAQSDAGKFTIVSCARMDNVNLGRPANDAQLQSRLRKMVMKHIGVLYFGYAYSNTPTSVMYSPILSVEDLDSLPEKY
jgi:predicted Zn-dependent protease